MVLKGLASDGGLFIPEEIPSLPQEWDTLWKDLEFSELAFNILSLYISPSEIPEEDLRDILRRSYSTFRVSNITPLHTLDATQNLHLLELFHGPTFAFKDVALQFLGNLFEYFLVRRNEGKEEPERHQLTVVGATSGDTGSAAIYGLRGKKDVSVFILHPHGRVSPIQEAQMTTVLDDNVHNLALEGTFDDCQDMVKALFADEHLNKTHKLGAVNSINWARILAQITYYFHAYFDLMRLPSFDASSSKVRFVVPTGNFGDILAGYFAKRMGLPIDRLYIATNENDILDRFLKTGRYEKQTPKSSEPALGLESDGAKADPSGVRETLSPAMDILVSSNFERLLYLLTLSSKQGQIATQRQAAAEEVKSWQADLKSKGGFAVSDEILKLAQESFSSTRVTDPQTLATIKTFYSPPSSVPGLESYILDPHSAVGVAASLRSMTEEDGMPPGVHTVSLATAHPAKFAGAVKLALEDVAGFDYEKDILPPEFVGLESKERRVKVVGAAEGIEGMRRIIREEVEGERRKAEVKWEDL